MAKPPPGIKPFTIHRHERMAELLDAINRYLESGNAIPHEWIWELSYHAESQRKEKREKESLDDLCARLNVKSND